MIKKTIILSLMFLTILSLFSSPPALAADPPTPADPCSRSFLGLPTWHKYLEKDDNCRVVGPCVDKDTGNVPGEDCNEADQSKTRLDVTKVVTRVALAVIDILMRVGGMVAFGFIVYSGFKFVLSQGNADQEKAARETAINAIIGLVITMFAIGIVTFVGRAISAG